MYVAAKAYTGPYKGYWVVIRKFDGALWSEEFITRQAAETYARFLNNI